MIAVLPSSSVINVLSLQAGPNLLLCPSTKSGGLWDTPGSGMVQLGKRTAGAQSIMDMQQEEAPESASEQVRWILQSQWFPSLSAPNAVAKFQQ